MQLSLEKISLLYARRPPTGSVLPATTQVKHFTFCISHMVHLQFPFKSTHTTKNRKEIHKILLD